MTREVHNVNQNTRFSTVTKGCIIFARSGKVLNYSKLIAGASLEEGRRELAISLIETSWKNSEPHGSNISISSRDKHSKIKSGDTGMIINLNGLNRCAFKRIGSFPRVRFPSITYSCMQSTSVQD